MARRPAQQEWRAAQDEKGFGFVHEAINRPSGTRGTHLRIDFPALRAGLGTTAAPRLEKPQVFPASRAFSIWGGSLSWLSQQRWPSVSARAGCHGRNARRPGWGCDYAGSHTAARKVREAAKQRLTWEIS